MQEWEFEPGV